MLADRPGAGRSSVVAVSVESAKASSEVTNTWVNQRLKQAAAAATLTTNRTDCPVCHVKQPPHGPVQTTASCSTAVLLVGADARKRPEPQASHCVSLLLVPTLCVHSPREQVLCTPAHATASDASFALVAGASILNLPLLHVEHCVSVVELPALTVHSPAEQVL